MRVEEFESFLHIGENDAIEFKRCGGNPAADIFESYCAFLNRFGGDIFLGVTDNGTVLGVPEQHCESVVKNLITVMNDSKQLDPPFYAPPETFEYQGKKIIHLHVPTSSNVHRFKGIYYDRVHESDVKVRDTEQITLMYIRKQNIYTEQKVYPYAGMAELKPGLLQLVRRLAASKDPKHPWIALTDEELVRSAGLLRYDFATGRSGLCAAGILLLGRDDVIQSVFPAYKTDALLRRAYLERYDDRVTVYTNLIDAQTQLIEFGEKWLPDKFFLENYLRVSLRGIILREAVGNLLIHREFTSSYPARMIIYKDKLVTTNACRSSGQKHITPQNLEPQSKNPIIAKFFKEIGYADELGSGVRKLFKYVQIYSGQEPEMVDDDIFRLSIPLDDYYSPEGDSTQDDRWCMRETLTSPMEDLTQTVLMYLKYNENCTQAKLVRRISGATPQKVKTVLKKLKEKGIIRRDGPPHGGRWIVNPAPPHDPKGRE